MKITNLIISGAMLFTVASTTQAASMLDTVKTRGHMVCGVKESLPGFAIPNSKGVWEGSEVDICRAVAAAVFGDATKVKFKPMSGKQRFTALQSGEIDMLARTTTWTYSRDVSLGANFVGVSYYDGQGFMVKKTLGVKSARELNGASICILSGTTSELNVTDYFRKHKMSYIPVIIDESSQVAKSFDAGRCDVMTSDQSQLYAQRIRLNDPKNTLVLPEVISKEPLGPVVRQGDDLWANVVRWSFNTMVAAEELGVTSANVDAQKASADPKVQRLLGVSGVRGDWMGLSDDWGYNIIKLVGNYGESFDRNLGAGSPLKIERGLNALWTEGGLQFSPPIR
ncbi:MAG: general L-amino acid transport system substrate-binding protein [Candidatus Endobugula sp.]|jgi:general L-amino acid transport system substrate-binding protein